MKNKLAKSFIVLTFGLLFFIFLSNQVRAEAGECKNQPCFVPAPTILSPQNNSTSTDEIIISGLTWKTTYVELYFDDKKVEQVKLVKHEDYYASFSARITWPVTKGEHKIHAYAFDEKNGWGGVSQESKHTIFYYSPKLKQDKNVITPLKPVEVNQEKFNQEQGKGENEQMKPVETKNSSSGYDRVVNDEQIVNVPPVKKINDNQQVDNLIETRQNYLEVNKDTGKTNERDIADGVSETKQPEVEKYAGIDEYQKRLKTNRIVGFVILAGIALVALIWLLLKEPSFQEELNSSLLDKEKNDFDSDDKVTK